MATVSVRSYVRDSARPVTRLLDLSLAVVPTALLLFLSSSLSLYVRNQEELHHQIAVLEPFVGSFAVTWLLGAALLLLSSRAPFRHLAWAYLLFAPFLLAFRFLSSMAESGATLRALVAGFFVASETGLLLWVGSFFLATFLAARRAAPAAIARPMAIFGVLLLLGETTSFLLGTKPPGPSRGYAPRAEIESASAPGGRPNVYHVVLDALTTDAFELERSPEVDRGLSGFVYFREHQAVYHGTLMSLGSMFASRRYAYDRDREQFVNESFGALSFVSTLRASGFRTVAIAPPSDPLEAGPFDDVVRHADNFERDVTTNTAAFVHLWTVASTPAPVLERLLRSDWLDEATRSELRLTMQGRALTDSSPLASRDSFRELARKEERDAASGHYTFVHLLLPHAPYVLRSDCSYQGQDRASDPRAQTRCAFALLEEYLDRLVALKRFDDALIVVHGDHGEPFKRRGDGLVPTRSRTLHTPLLVKPPGRTRGRPLVECDFEASLLDVAPTILDFLKTPPERALEGMSLRDRIAACTADGSM